MFGNIGTAIRFFAIGLGVGLLTAPRRGEETRAMLREQLFRLTGLSDEQTAEMTTRIQGGLRQAQQAAREATRQASQAATEVREGIAQATGEATQRDQHRRQPHEGAETATTGQA